MNALEQRITDYLAGGGLFNPELANHDAVRDLLIDCRAALAAPPAPSVACEPCSLCGALIAPRNATHYDPADLKAAEIRGTILAERLAAKNEAARGSEHGR